MRAAGMRWPRKLLWSWSPRLGSQLGITCPIFSACRTLTCKQHTSALLRAHAGLRWLRPPPPQVRLYGAGLPYTARDFELLPIPGPAKDTQQPQQELDAAADVMAVVAQRLGRGRGLAGGSRAGNRASGVKQEAAGVKQEAAAGSGLSCAAGSGGEAMDMDKEPSAQGTRGTAGADPGVGAMEQGDRERAEMLAGVVQPADAPMAEGLQETMGQEVAMQQEAVTGPSTSQPPQLQPAQLRAAWAADVDPLGHEPFPRMHSLVVHYNKRFMRSRLRSLANILGLRELRIAGEAAPGRVRGGE